MSSISRKFKKNKIIEINMSIKFKCNLCGYEKLISQNTIQQLEKATFAENEIFKCKNCNIRMTPITVEVDY